MEELGKNIFKCNCGELLYSLEEFLTHIIMHIENEIEDADLTDAAKQFYYSYLTNRFLNAIKEFEGPVGKLKNKICKN